MIITKPKLTEEQLNITRLISDNFGLGIRTAKVLVSRGIDTLEKANKFLNAGKHNFLNPHLISGISEAKEKILLACQQKKKILIFGDYDADGICASSVLYYALKSLGVTATVYIPERALGYGITDKSLEEVFALSPELIITVDCGIGSAEEIELIKSKGIEVIVTDHHELPDKLPDCIKINCKIKSDYPYNNLCGAGVAYKLAKALIGDKADELLDLVAIATVADSMDLIDENRDLVVEGLKLLAKNPRPQIKALLDLGKSKEITSGLLAFTIAPRINACGRMGNARLALQLMLSEEQAQMREIAEKLNEYNALRQSECESLYKQAKEKLLKEGLDTSVIVLFDENWQTGLVGIVSARLCEEFNRPTILFTLAEDGIYKGSARSIEGINIFEAISACEEYLHNFGGHSQAAGVSVTKESFESFKRAINEYISKNCFDKFVKKVVVEEFITSPVTISDAKDLLRLEPFGTGNKKPLFAMQGHSYKIFKLNGNHISLKTSNLEMLYFNGLSYAEDMADETVKTLVFDLNYSLYNGTESVKGFIKSYERILDQSKQCINSVFAGYLNNLLKENKACKAKSKQEIDEVIKECLQVPYGTLFAISDMDNLQLYPFLSHLTVDLNKPSDNNHLNKIVVGYTGGGEYSRVIYLDNGYTPTDGIICADVVPYKRLNFSRETLVKVFKIYSTPYVSISDIIAKNPEFDSFELIFATTVLLELGILKKIGGYIVRDKSVKSDIENSKIYQKFLNR